MSGLRMVLLLACLLLASLTPPLHAAQFCATTAEELVAHLLTAGGNGEDDSIRIAAGIYMAPDGGFAFAAQATDAANTLELSGGWSAAGNDPCGSGPSGNGFDTVLDGGHAARVLRVHLGAAGDLAVRGLTLRNGSTPGAFDDGGGLLVLLPSGEDYAGTVLVEGNALLDNEAAQGGGLYLYSTRAGTQAALVVRNNLFAGNHARSNWGAAYVAAHGPSAGAGTIVHVVHNSVLDNTSAGTDGPPTGGVLVSGASGVERVVANNLLWNNQDNDLQLSGSSGHVLLHNDIGLLGGFDPVVDEGNISVDPQLASCGGCPPGLPATGSPLIEAGTSPTAADSWTLPALDLEGRARVAGTAPDIGAFENHDLVFADGFEGM